MTAGKYDFTIEQGATFRKVFRWQQSNGYPVDLTGTTAKMHKRKLIDFNTQGGHHRRGSRLSHSLSVRHCHVRPELRHSPLRPQAHQPER